MIPLFGVSLVPHDGLLVCMHFGRQLLDRQEQNRAAFEYLDAMIAPERRAKRGAFARSAAKTTSKPGMIRDSSKAEFMSSLHVPRGNQIESCR